jgi:hypothetical protein
MSRCTEIVVAAVLLGATPAWAHDSASSSFEARPASTGLQVVFRLDATSVAERAGDDVLGYLDRRFVVTHDGRPCPRDPARALLHGDRAVAIDVIYRCTGALRLESTLFHDEAIPHQLIGTFQGARHFFTRGERTMSVVVIPPVAGGFRTATPPPGAFAGAARPSVEPSGKRDRRFPVIAIVLGAFMVALASHIRRRLYRHAT